MLLHHPTRRSVGYFGAVRLRDGKFLYRREENKFNAKSFLEFMKALRMASCHSGRRVVIIADNVRYHHARLHEDWRQRAAPEFRLEFLPPYSPDMNPSERVWKLTRRKATHNRYFAELNNIIDAVEFTFDQWTTGNETLRRLCAIF